MAEAARQFDYRYSASPRRRERGTQLHELPLVRPRRGDTRQIHTRERVHLRQPDPVSIFPVAGLLLTAFLCVWIVLSYSRLNQIYGQTVVARSELTALEQEGKTLSAQYEEIFDKAALEAAIEASGSSLSEIKSSQKVYVDLSEPDNAIVYQANGGGLLEHLKGLFFGPSA